MQITGACLGLVIVGLYHWFDARLPFLLLFSIPTILILLSAVQTLSKEQDITDELQLIRITGARPVQALLAVLPARCVLSDAEDTRPYECDGLAAYRQLPMVVTLPDTEEQVIAILGVCRELKVPIVPRGAGAGPSFGVLVLIPSSPLRMSTLLTSPEMSPKRFDSSTQES